MGDEAKSIALSEDNNLLFYATTKSIYSLNITNRTIEWWGPIFIDSLPEPEITCTSTDDVCNCDPPPDGSVSDGSNTAGTNTTVDGTTITYSNCDCTTNTMTITTCINNTATTVN